MESYRNEKLLSYFYPFIMVSGFVCSVTSAIAWHHWKYVLDTCVEVNCGCILNGVSTITYFTGGHVAYCYWATFGLILSMVVALIFGSFHVYRMCIASGKQRSVSSHSVRQRSGEVIVMTARSETNESDISPQYWLTATFAAAFMALYSLVHAILYVDGVFTSCRQYRNELIKYMHATGPLVAAVQGRLTCSSIFDFMDYLHPDVNFDRRRLDRINSSWCLMLAMIASCATFVLWIATFIVNFVQVRRTSKLRV